MRLAAVLMLCAGMAVADAPENSLRPQARPTTDRVSRSEPEPHAEIAMVAISLQAVALSMRPPDRPAAVVQQAAAVTEATRRGSVCGVPEIQGEVVAVIRGSGDCGIAEPVRIRSVSGVALNDASLMDCTTAKALNTWVRQSARPRIADQGGGLAALRVAGSYVCRGRNNVLGARMSEHGRGRAIDIAGFVLRDGSAIMVESGWNSRADRRQLRRMHDDACGTFTTVLGPAANADHRDHFHFDTARGRGGAYCR